MSKFHSECEARTTEFKNYSFNKDGSLGEVISTYMGFYCKRCEQCMFSNWRPWKCKGKNEPTD